MTPEKRLQQISELADANERAYAEIERRAAAHEADPLGFDAVMLLADRRVTGDESDLCYGDATDTPVGSPYMRRSPDVRGLVYRTRDDAMAPAPQPAPAPSNGNGIFGDWRDDHLAKNLGVIIATLRKEWRAEIERERGRYERKLAELQGENAELRHMLDTSGKAVSRLAAEVVSERRDREALFATLEQNFCELKAFVRGVTRDFWSAT
jgi:hypothetical protein